MACLLLAKHNTGKHARLLIGPPEKDNNGTWVCTYPIINDSWFRAISAISTGILMQQKTKHFKFTGMFQCQKHGVGVLSFLEGDRPNSVFLGGEVHNQYS